MEDLLRSKGIEVPPESEEATSSSPNEENGVGSSSKARQDVFNLEAQTSALQPVNNSRFEVSNEINLPMTVPSESGNLGASYDVNMQEGNDKQQKSSAAWNPFFSSDVLETQMPPPSRQVYRSVTMIQF